MLNINYGYYNNDTKCLVFNGFYFHFDYGNAWTGEIPGFDEFKKGAGAEIRLHMNSYYLFPTALFFNASSLNLFTASVPVG